MRLLAIITICGLIAIALHEASCESEKRGSSIRIAYMEEGALLGKKISEFVDGRLVLTRQRLPSEVGTRWEMDPELKDFKSEVYSRIRKSLVEFTGVGAEERHPPGLWDVSHRHPGTGNILFFYYGLVPTERDKRVPDIPVSRIGGQSLFIYREHDSAIVLVDSESKYSGTDDEFSEGRHVFGISWAGFDVSGRKVCYWVNNQAYLYDINRDTRLEVVDFNIITPTDNLPFYLAYRRVDSTYALLDSGLTIQSTIKGPQALRLRECFLLDSNNAVVTIQRYGKNVGNACIALSFRTQEVQQLLRFRYGQILSARFVDSSTSPNQSSSDIH